MPRHSLSYDFLNDCDLQYISLNMSPPVIFLSVTHVHEPKPSKNKNVSLLLLPRTSQHDQGKQLRTLSFTVYIYLHNLYYLLWKKAQGCQEGGPF